MGNHTKRSRPFLDSARRPRKQGTGVANPRIIRLTASDVVAAPDAHPNSKSPRQRRGDAARTLDKNASISELDHVLAAVSDPNLVAVVDETARTLGLGGTSDTPSTTRLAWSYELPTTCARGIPAVTESSFKGKDGKPS
jgi:hypothetical protein